MAQLICPKCKKQIDDTSAFCTFCGEKITDEVKHDAEKAKEKPKFKASLKSAPKAKTLIQIGVIIALIIAIVLLVIECYRVKKQVNDLADKNNKLSIELEDVKTKLSSTSESLTEANETIKNQKSSNSSLIAENTKLKREAKDSGETLNDLYSFLKKSKTSNGTISTSSNVYCVRKGETATIRISWNRAATMYMSSSGSAINAAWTSNSDVKITGKRKGVSTVDFSSDQSGSKNKFSVTVICYE